MLLESPEPSTGDETMMHDDTDVHRHTARGPSQVGRAIQDDVELLIAIAAQLFNAIERQIRHIEEELNHSIGGLAPRPHQIVFKEQLIRTARNLDSALDEVAYHLGDRVVGADDTTRSRFAQ